MDASIDKYNGAIIAGSTVGLTVNVRDFVGNTYFDANWKDSYLSNFAVSLMING